MTDDFAEARWPSRNLVCRVAYSAIENCLTFSYNDGPWRPVAAAFLCLGLTRIAMAYLGEYESIEPYQASKSILL